MKRFGGRRVLVRVLMVWVLTALAIRLAAGLMAGVTIEGEGTALISAALIGLINALVWPFVIRVALPFTVLTLGLGVLVLNGLVVLAASSIDSGLVIDGLAAAIGVALVITLVNTLATSLMAVDDDDFYTRHVIKRQAQRVTDVEKTDVPGVIFLEIDGLAYDIAQRAIRDGDMPNMSRWLRDGSHEIARWETDWSSQTGACQAGLLHGNNEDMPAFRWWEKDRNTAIVTNKPRDAAELERRVSDGHGLLSNGGASRANIVSGDATHSLLTMSTVLNMKRPGRIGQDYFAYFADPYNVTRTLISGIAEYYSERRSAKRQVRLDVYPRVHRSRSYAVARVWATILQLNLQVSAVIGDIYAGRPVCYSTFLAYDEVAHHSGIERADTLATLRRVDRALGRIVSAADDAPRPYRFVFLSDHGQSQGATFLDRYGISFEDVVTQACGTDHVDIEAQGSEALNYVGASLTEASEGQSVSAKLLRRLTRRNTVDGEVLVSKQSKADVQSAAGGKDELPEISVMASGCLGLVSFPRLPGRVTLEQIDAHYPALIETLRDHPGVGFVMVRSEQSGSIVIGKNGRHFLADGRVEGEDPLTPFGANAARHVARTDG
ncbi:MAG: phage holin family protein, partial [Thermoleophilaceae bacterium]|nr:phage holin family protein [Thermoleophilaceae bacterium]